MLKVALATLLCALLSVAAAQSGSPAGCKGVANPYAPLTHNATFVRSVPNGKLYIDYGVTPAMRVVHLWGNAYESGVAAGKLLSAELKVFLPRVMTYFQSQAGDAFPKDTPRWVLDLIEKYGVPFALDWTYDMTKSYTPAHFEDELRGWSDGSGIDLTMFRRLNMIPELIKASCSMVGAWGPAVAHAGESSTLYQLRALDWDTEGPFNDFPVVMVYHADGTMPKGGHSFATLGWIGFVGALTGYSSANVGICEKYWGGYNGTYAEAGYPFPYVLRDILQFDKNNAEAYSRIEKATRTCAIFVGLGDSTTNQFRAVEYSHDVTNIFSDKTFPEYPAHPRREGLVYVDKHFQPSNDPCLANVLEQRYGELDAKALIYAASMHKTGDNHAAIYDFARNLMYVSSASTASLLPAVPVIPAYNRQFLKLDLNALWSEPKP